MNRENEIQKKLKEISERARPRTTFAEDEVSMSLTRKSQRNVYDVLNLPNLNLAGKVEISIADSLMAMGPDACKDRDLVKLLKEEFKDTFCHEYGNIVRAWRERGDNLIAYVENGQIESKILESRGILITKLRIYMRIKPLIEEGSIDYRYYRIKVSLDYHLSLEIAAMQLGKLWNAWEIIIGDSEIGDDGTITVIAWLDSEEALRNLGKTITVLGFTCHISHPYLYECSLCKGRGHWENKCAIIKTTRENLAMISYQVERLGRERSKTIIAYNCYVQKKLQCLITEVTTNRDELNFRFQRMGEKGDKVTIRIEDEDESISLVRYIQKQGLENFALMESSASNRLKGIPRGNILNATEVLIWLWTKKYEGDLAIRKRKHSESTWTTDDGAKGSVARYRQPTLKEYFEEESESSVINRESLKIVHINICGLINKGEVIQDLIYRRDADIIGVCETHIDNSITAPKIEGCIWHGVNGNRRKKGVGFYVKQGLGAIPFKSDQQESPNEGRIVSLKFKDLVVIEAYAPVECKPVEMRKEFFQFLVSLVAKARVESNKIVILGDFNAHVTGFPSSETNSNGKLLLSLVKSTKLKLLPFDNITYLGRHGGTSCVDYVLATMPQRL